ncbi:MAG: formyl transferase [Rikenellaceae bacterium]|nr:formyl transferase [Rikenellaceae bacterium]MCL2693344.1 formyl transferase [Rikenellaceae bacterium]
MVVRILGEEGTAAYMSARAVVESLGHKIDDGRYFAVDLAIAPLLTQIIPVHELNEPIHGTLIFHPSPLPYGRGASAIKHAYTRREPLTAATWFWADAGIDTGDICEMEIVKIDYSLRPREFYERDIIPALGRTLARALADISRGIIRRIPQVERFATYDKRI